ncbi:hypothetical protein GPECTOR_19g307 [Gonium pectorale]|uniref:Methyltransferase FkbM domain-containing protein n=1 Tax=Gonium pectorale TaxID=33097 RepID=A0A150GJ86_GONPE|nr:hypothetical protein GPECTOR_19g307 [Gonium pectorale]|eukprot:KXZ49856.1 hypothetical protein GPECTOR_19g307 [Gonium pectorale]
MMNKGHSSAYQHRDEHSGKHLEPAQLGTLSYSGIFNRLNSSRDTICKFGVCVEVVCDKGDIYLQHITTNPTEVKIGQSIVDALRQVPSSERSNYVALDVGMSQGYFTLLPAALGFETHAFEPQPACVALVLAALEGQPGLAENVYIHNVALGDRADGESLQLHVGMCQMMYAGGVNDEGRSWNKERGTRVRVPVKRLDGYLGERRAAVVKIDVEGAEVLVLEGLVESVQAMRVNMLIIEVSRSQWQLHGVSDERGAEVFLRLFKAASRVVHLEQDKVMEDFESFLRTAGYEQSNMLFAYGQQSVASHQHI